MTDETEIQETITPTASMPSGNTPQDIVDIYNVLAPMSTDYANANIERAGQAQSSYGPLAQAAMGDSQTAGIGNYTYNRLIRPSVDVMRDQLVVEGLSSALNKQISDSLQLARENYNRAARRYSTGGGGDKDKDNKNKNGPLDIDDEYTDGTGEDGSDDGKKDNTKSVSTLPSRAPAGSQNVGSATVNGQTRIVYKLPDGRYHIQGVGSYRGGSKVWEDVKKQYNVSLNPYPGSDIFTIF